VRLTVCVSGALAISDITVGEIFGPDVPDTLQRAYYNVACSKLEIVCVCVSLRTNLHNRDLLVPPSTLIFYMRNHGILFKFVYVK